MTDMPPSAPPERPPVGEADVAAGLAEVRASVARAARDFERDPSEINLIAISKTVSAEGILPALEAGQRLFGENYVQEAKGKWPGLKERYPDAELHFVGPLQSNKAREAVQLFDVIHSLDRPSLAKELAKAIEGVGRTPRLLIQVNTGDESQKAGIAPDALGGLLAACRDSYGLAIHGLMCIPPFADAPSPHFALLARLAREHGLPLLSMGMSADYEAAIQLGATHVRVGTAIFGARAKR